MRHQCKLKKLSKPADQRKALLRSLATELFIHGEIKTTMTRAKALAPYAENVISLAKKGDLASRRQALRHIYDKEIEKFVKPESELLSNIVDFSVGRIAISEQGLIYLVHAQQFMMIDANNDFNGVV